MPALLPWLVLFAVLLMPVPGLSESGGTDEAAAAAQASEPAQTADSVDQAQPGEQEGIDPLSASYLLRLVGSLLLVIGVMFVVVWLLKRSGGFDHSRGAYPMQVLSSVSVGPRERVVLVRVGERQALLGVAPGRVNNLGWLEPQVAPVSPESADIERMTAHLPSAFARVLRRQQERREAGK
ncbi:MAG: flagellar biosynthetic protein FliO [Halothiobacillaceae bacterium]